MQDHVDEERAPRRPILLRALRAAARPLVHALRRALHALLHPRRRRRALRLLDQIKPVRSVAFVCLGNICRSPYAAAVAEAGFGRSTEVRVLSAGLLRGGRSCPSEAVAVAAELGYDLNGHVSRRVDASLLGEIDLVVVMDPEHEEALVDRGLAPRERILVLGDLDPSARPGRRTVADPFGGDVELFREVYGRIDRCMQVLGTELEGDGKRTEGSAGTDGREGGLADLRAP